MPKKFIDMSPLEQIAFWSDKIRDISATGLQYQTTVYDRERFEALQSMAIEMLAFATMQTIEELEPLRSTVFSRMSPIVAGAAAVIDEDGNILLMRRSDNGLWNMPGGMLEVGETPAEGVVRETYEETGVRCKPIALSGIYDSRIWDVGRTQHIYKFTFLCEPLSKDRDTPSHENETLDFGWFAKGDLPDNLYEGHRQRIQDAYKVRDENYQPHFDY